MDFVSIRLITGQVDRLVSFYEQVTGLKATRYSEDFAEVKSPTCTLAIGSTRTVQVYGPGVVEAAPNRSVFLEFRVKDVDEAFDRLKPLVSGFVMEPTTMPWGNRSLLLRDPDGNLINLFAPVSPKA